MGLFTVTAVHMHKKCSNLCEVQDIVFALIKFEQQCYSKKENGPIRRELFFRQAQMGQSETLEDPKFYEVYPKLVTNIRRNEQTIQNRTCSLNRFVLYLGLKPVARVGSASTLISCSLARTNRYSPSRSLISSTVTFRRGLPERPGQSMSPSCPCFRFGDMLGGSSDF